MVESALPNDIWEAALKSDGEHTMDIVWGSLEPKLPHLGSIALSVLVVSHTNAGEERVFSMIKKNKTDFRALLQLAGSLNSIMRIKMSHLEELLPCHKWKPPKDLLKNCKSATRKYNEAHSSKH